MNQKQKAPKQPQDPYGRQGKVLTSSVQRLRGWVGSDPSRVPELADALVELTAHRLLGHGYAAAAADAQESVRRAAELLTANGPVGPYTAAGDASRYLTAVVHLATLQAAVGQPAVAGRTLEALQPLHEQLRELGLEAPLDLATALWALSTTSRAALAGGRREEANACADAALARARWRPAARRTPSWATCRWTSPGWPRTRGGRRAGRRSRSASCTSRRTVTTPSPRAGCRSRAG